MRTAGEMLVAQERRLRGLDPLVPAVTGPPDGEVLTAETSQGRVAGVLLRTDYPPGSPARMWSAAAVSELVPVLGDGGHEAMDAVLTAWRRRLPDLDLPATDSACVLSWPSRDVEAARALLDHGFVPLSVLAVRVPGSAPRPAPAPVRRATPDDLAGCVELALAEQRYSAMVGGTVLRPDAAETKRAVLAARLQRAEPIWIAEQGGVAVGLAECGYSDSVPGSWTATRLPPGRWGFINCASVLPGARSRGLGRALVAHVHAAFAAEGAAGSYLYYNPPNPLSSVFWPRHGYRPLWTVWEARPAAAVR